MTDSTPPASEGADTEGEEVDGFDVKMEKFIHTFIADAQPTDGPAPGA